MKRIVHRACNIDECSVDREHLNVGTRECRLCGAKHERHPITLGSKHLRQLGRQRHRMPDVRRRANFSGKRPKQRNERIRRELQLEGVTSRRQDGVACHAGNLDVDAADIPAESGHINAKCKMQNANSAVSVWTG